MHFIERKLTVIAAMTISLTLGMTGLGQASTTNTSSSAGAPQISVATATSAAVDCRWEVTTNGAQVWAKNGRGEWYPHHKKEVGSTVIGPPYERGPEWVKVYMGVGGEGLMKHWDLRLKSGPCR
jgi:hypothetical protein